MADKLIIACDGGEQTLYVGNINPPHESMVMPMVGSPITMRDAFMIKTMYLPAQNEMTGKVEMVQQIKVVPIGFNYSGATISIRPTWVSDPSEDEDGMKKLLKHIEMCKEDMKLKRAADAGLTV